MKELLTDDREIHLRLDDVEIIVGKDVTLRDKPEVVGYGPVRRIGVFQSHHDGDFDVSVGIQRPLPKVGEAKPTLVYAVCNKPQSPIQIWTSGSLNDEANQYGQLRPEEIQPEQRETMEVANFYNQYMFDLTEEAQRDHLHADTTHP